MTVRLTPAVYKILTGDDDEYDRLQNVLGDLMQENAALTRCGRGLVGVVYVKSSHCIQEPQPCTGVQ